MTVSAIGLFVLIFLFARDGLKVRKKDIPFLVIFGLFKLLTDVTFFFAQVNMTMCLATLLQLTAPYFVMVLSLILFKEKITLKKLMAMAVGTTGCVLVTGVLFGDVSARTEGVICAILSGLFISMFFIGNRMAIDRDIRPTTILFYTTLFADLMALPFINAGDVIGAVSTPEGLGMALALGIIMTLIPYYLMTWSSFHIEPTIVAMISVLEVVFASIVGFIVFNEQLDIPHIIGMGLVIMSIILINVKIRLEYIKRYGKYVSPLWKFVKKPIDVVTDHTHL